MLRAQDLEGLTEPWVTAVVLGSFLSWIASIALWIIFTGVGTASLSNSWNLRKYGTAYGSACVVLALLFFGSLRIENTSRAYFFYESAVFFLVACTHLAFAFVRKKPSWDELTSPAFLILTVPALLCSSVLLGIAGRGEWPLLPWCAWPVCAWLTGYLGALIFSTTELRARNLELETQNATLSRTHQQVMDLITAERNSAYSYGRRQEQGYKRDEIQSLRHEVARGDSRLRDANSRHQRDLASQAAGHEENLSRLKRSLRQMGSQYGESVQRHAAALKNLEEANAWNGLMRSAQIKYAEPDYERLRTNLGRVVSRFAHVIIPEIETGNIADIRTADLVDHVNLSLEDTWYQLSRLERMKMIHRVDPRPEPYTALTAAEQRWAISDEEKSQIAEFEGLSERERRVRVESVTHYGDNYNVNATNIGSVGPNSRGETHDRIPDQVLELLRLLDRPEDYPQEFQEYVRAAHEDLRTDPSIEHAGTIARRLRSVLAGIGSGADTVIKLTMATDGILKLTN